MPLNTETVKKDSSDRMQRKWFLHLRCESCKEEYDANMQTVTLGPLEEYVVTGKETVSIGEHEIEKLQTRKLYDGRVLSIHCPYCLLRLALAQDIGPPAAWKKWVKMCQETHPELNLSELFDEGFRIKQFPMNCPRCTRIIAEENQFKRCVHCDSSRVAVVRSYAGEG